jgi:hypothetical protein
MIQRLFRLLTLWLTIVAPLSTAFGQVSQDTTQQPQLVIAVIEFGTLDPLLQVEGARIADSIQLSLMTNTTAVVIDRVMADAQLSQNQIVLNKLSSDSSYWANIGRQLGASKIVYGQVTKFNDTTGFADIFVTDIVRNRTTKAVVMYNPVLDTTLSEKIKRVVLGLIVRGEAVQLTQQKQEEDNLLLWILGGLVVAGGGVAAVVLFGGGSTASSNDLPPPPDLPPQPSP